MNPIILL